MNTATIRAEQKRVMGLGTMENNAMDEKKRRQLLGNLAGQLEFMAAVIRATNPPTEDVLCNLNNTLIRYGKELTATN